MSIHQLTTSVYDQKTRKMLDNMIVAKLRQTWFDNYEANKPLIMEHMSYEQNEPDIKGPAIVVGAGWSLHRNISEIQDMDVPVLACDKKAALVTKYVKPYAVSALNSEPTKVKEWLTDFNEEMARQGYDPDDVIFFVPTTVNPEVFEVWKGNKICFMSPDNVVPELTSLTKAETGLIPTIRGSNVGLFSYINAVSMNAKKVVLLGMNFCYRTMQEAIDATRGEGFVAMKDVTKRNPLDILGQGFVYATLEWVEMRAEFVNIAYDLLDKVKTVNASEGGILYEAGVIEPVDFRAWKTFLKEEMPT